MPTPLLFALLPSIAFAWDRPKAFEYLESRQQQWADWKPAQKPGGPCISCHTGLSYLIARRVIAAGQPRPLEAALIGGVKSRLLAKPIQTMLTDPGAESVLNLLTLSLERRTTQDPLTQPDRIALSQLWDRQLQDGPAKGSWTWFDNGLDPVDSEFSNYFGTALAELAVAAYPDPPAQPLAALRAFLEREAPRQPLHNRLAWIAFSPATQAAPPILSQLWEAQSDDGGWSTASLGPWPKHDEAPPDPGSNAYSTAWAAFTAHRAGVACTDPRLTRALDWLERRQDPASGAWHSISMNKVYSPGSIQAGFMTDAATGYAAAALIACGR